MQIQFDKRDVLVWEGNLGFFVVQSITSCLNFMHDCVHDRSLASHKHFIFKNTFRVIYAFYLAYEKFDV